VSEFDFEGVFNEDYLYFYEDILTAERTQEDVETIVELLELEPGSEILDCPCGHGRIANALAERGFRVTGIDSSEFFLDRAREAAAERGVEVEYVQGDMRALPWQGRFDALVNWFTSFGYFSDEQNKDVLRQFHDALKPGGRLILETQNITRIILNPRPVHFIERDGDLMLDEWDLDVENARFVTQRIVVRGGQTRRTQFVIRWFSVPELRAWLHAKGFDDVRTPGVTAETRLIVVADRSSS
jgi:2-polyprenyl-3-methyl-5-hydroxy-6-metoxy-1,4-benzoquinol methylase